MGGAIRVLNDKEKALDSAFKSKGGGCTMQNSSVMDSLEIILRDR
jgi:hypothetical protein